MREVPIEPAKIIPVLLRSRLGRHVNEAELATFLSMCVELEFEPGETVIVETSLEHDMYVVVQDSVVIEVQGPDRPMYVCTLGEGELIGEAGLFANARRTASVRSADTSRLLKFSREIFLRLLKEKPAIAIKLMFMMIYSLLSRLRIANEELIFERRGDETQGDIDAMIQDLIPLETSKVLEGLSAIEQKHES